MGNPPVPAFIWIVMYARLLLLTSIVVGFGVQAASAQAFEQLTTAYPDSLCGSCAAWNAPQAPFQIHLNSYYVGTHGLSALLIASSEGHILIDGALPNSAPQILRNIRALGFDPTDVKLILNTHTHFDHAGGIAALQQATGARVAAAPASAPVLAQGRNGPDDPQYGVLLDFPAASNVGIFSPGDTLQVGALRVVAHATAGHAPGGTSWSWPSCVGDDCLHIVYADSQTPVSADGFRFTDTTAYPTALADFERGFDTLERLPCDILITTHPSASSLWARVEEGPAGLVDSEACRRYADAARKRLAKRLRTEAAAVQPQE